MLTTTKKEKVNYSRVFRRKNQLFFINRVILLQSALCILPIISHAQKIAAGGQHSFAICDDSTLMSWGDNPNGALGNGNNTDSNIPVQVSSLTDIIAIEGGQYHCLALKNAASGGTVWSWGANVSGGLGNGTSSASNVPVQVSLLTNVIDIAAGEHSLALKNDSTVWVWGINSLGQLGTGNNTSSNVPLQIISLTGVIDIAGGLRHSLALKSDGTLRAWGANFSGQLGNGANADKNFPVPVNSLTGIVAIAGGNNFSLALKNDGTVWAWGGNQFGTLGNGTNSNSNIPVQVNLLTGIIAITCGSYHCLALKNDGTVWSWGGNSNGMLGNGTNADSNVPVQISSLSNIVAIDGGDQHSLALKNNGTVWAWGWNMYGQLGNGNNTTSNIPVQVTGLCSVTISVNENKEPLNVSVFPNPATDYFSIVFQNNLKKADISIIDITGKIIYTTSSGEKLEVNTKDFANGVYIVRIQDANAVAMKKLLIQR